MVPRDSTVRVALCPLGSRRRLRTFDLMDIGEGPGCVAWWTLFGRSNAKASMFAHHSCATLIAIAPEMETDIAALPTVATDMNQSAK